MPTCSRSTKPSGINPTGYPLACDLGEVCQALLVGSVSDEEAKRLLNRFATLRQHQRNGQRSPHKPLLVLLALGRLAETGSSVLPWSVAEPVLADLIAEFGPPSRTGRGQSAAYPFTRLRTDGVWVLDQDVPTDLVGPLATRHVAGRFEEPVEDALRADPTLIRSMTRTLVLSNFPDTVAPDVVEAVGLDPRIVLGGADVSSYDRGKAGRHRDPGWRSAVLQAWDRQCAFCGYDGQLGGAVVGIDAAHVRSMFLSPNGASGDSARFNRNDLVGNKSATDPKVMAVGVQAC